MKKLLKCTALLLLLFTFTSVKSQVKSNDTDDILKVVKLYISVTDNKDSTAISKSFHPDAKLLSVNKAGELRIMTTAEWWSRVSKISNPTARKNNIKILDISGVSAVVKVEFETSCDYISLLKLTSGWKIVNKTLSIVL
jgi:Putative lumazine-binding